MHFEKVYSHMCPALGSFNGAPYDKLLRLSTDFSVVLFRPTFMLTSEEYRMKVHTNQWLLAMPYPRDLPSGATSRGHTMAPEGQTNHVKNSLYEIGELSRGMFGIRAKKYHKP